MMYLNPIMDKKAKIQLDPLTLKIILFFIDQLDGVLGRTHLQKLLFLTDLLSSKKLNKQLTNLDYTKFHFGPYSKKVQDYVKALETKGLIKEREYTFLSDTNKKYSRFIISRKTGIREKLLEELGPDTFVMLDDVAKSFGNMTLNELLDFVYSLQMVKTSEKNEKLDTTKDKNGDLFEIMVKVKEKGMLNKEEQTSEDIDVLLNG